MGYVVDRVAMGQSLLRVLQLLPATAISPILRPHSRNKTSANYSVVKNTFSYSVVFNISPASECNCLFNLVKRRMHNVLKNSVSGMNVCTSILP